MGIDLNDPSTEISSKTRLQIIQIFSQISSSRQSLITMEDQRSLYKRINVLGIVIKAENSNLNSKPVQMEMISYMKRVLYIYGELLFKYNRSFGDIVWRAITRVVLYILSVNALYFDEEIMHKTWMFLNIIKRRKIDKFLTVNATDRSKALADTARAHYLYSGIFYKKL